MKTIHVCETCGAQYEDQNLAINCEVTHKQEAERAEKERLGETKLLEAISAGINLYIKRYRKMPRLDLTEESAEVLFSQTVTISQ